MVRTYSVSFMITIEDNKRKFIENLLIKFPLVKLCELIISKHHKNFTFRKILLNRLEGMVSVTGLARKYFLIKKFKFGMFFAHRFSHSETVFSREKRSCFAKRSKEGRADKYFMQIEFIDCGKCDGYMTLMNGIKTAAKKSDFVFIFAELVGHT